MSQAGVVLQRQLDACRHVCEDKKLTIVAEYVDVGVSGNTPLELRPGSRQLLADADQFDAVLIESPDRLARELSVLSRACASLQQRGATMQWVDGSPEIARVLTAMEVGR